MAHPLETGIAGEAKNVTATGILKVIHDLRRSIVPVSTYGDDNTGPVTTNTGDDVAQNLRGLFPRGPLARSKYKTNRLAGRGIVNVDRLETIAPGMGVEQAELLIAICPVGGVINVQNNMTGNGVKTVTEQINQGQSHACQFPPGRRVLEP